MNTAHTYLKGFSIASGIAILAFSFQITAHAAGICTADPDEMTHWYGNAGGPAGSDAITRKAKCGAPVRSTSSDQLDKFYGNAGGKVGSDAVPATPIGGPSVASGYDSFPVVYGRAGYPTGSDAVVAISGKREHAPAVAQGSANVIK